jgi:hypothetical protein
MCVQYLFQLPACLLHARGLGKISETEALLDDSTGNLIVCCIRFRTKLFLLPTRIPFQSYVQASDTFTGDF